MILYLGSNDAFQGAFGGHPEAGCTQGAAPSNCDTKDMSLCIRARMTQCFLTGFTQSLKVTYTGLVISKLLHKYIPKSISAWICKHSNVNQISGREGDEGSGRETSELGDLISALLIL